MVRCLPNPLRLCVCVDHHKKCFCTCLWLSFLPSGPSISGVLDLGQKFTMCFFSGVECFGGEGRSADNPRWIIQFGVFFCKLNLINFSWAPFSFVCEFSTNQNFYFSGIFSNFGFFHCPQVLQSLVRRGPPSLDHLQNRKTPTSRKQEKNWQKIGKIDQKLAKNGIFLIFCLFFSYFLELGVFLFCRWPRFLQK